MRISSQLDRCTEEHIANILPKTKFWHKAWLIVLYHFSIGSLKYTKNRIVTWSTMYSHMATVFGSLMFHTWMSNHPNSYLEQANKFACNISEYACEELPEHHT